MPQHGQPEWAQGSEVWTAEGKPPRRQLKNLAGEDFPCNWALPEFVFLWQETPIAALLAASPQRDASQARVDNKGKNLILGGAEPWALQEMLSDK